MKQQKFVIKAVGYNMWVESLEKIPFVDVPKANFTLIRDKAYIFLDQNEANQVVTSMNLQAKELEFCLKEVEE